MFEFWDNLPVVGPYFAGMPEIVKTVLTGMIILIILVIGAKALKGGGKSGGGRRHRHREEEVEEAETTEEEAPSEELNNLGLGEASGGGGGESIESMLAGQPITPESELFPEEKGGSVESLLGESEAKPKEEKKKKSEEKPEKAESVGLPTEVETVLTEEEESKGEEEKKPVEYEEIDLSKMPKVRGRQVKEGQPVKQKKTQQGKETTEKGETTLTEKNWKKKVMEMLDQGKGEREILSLMFKMNIGRGRARVMFKQLEDTWNKKRKPLLNKKKELEEQKKILQYKYLKMQITEDNFKKLMNDVQKQLLEIEAKLKSTEKLFT